MSVRAVFLSGGEPLIVKGIVEAIEKCVRNRIAVYMYSSGWDLDSAKVDTLAPLLVATHISLDGATADVHDSVRQRSGAFDRAMRALYALNEASTRRRAMNKPPIQFGIDATLIQSNFHQLEALATVIPARFPEMSFANIGAAVPAGVASTEWFAKHELLTEEQLAVLRRGVAVPRGRKLLLSFSDQKHLQMHPADIARGTANIDTMQLEPDGSVRAMPMYEGTVGNIFEEPPELLWKRAQERWHDPFVVAQLTPVKNAVEWAAATRAIDQRYAGPRELERIAKRLTVLST